MTENSPEAKAAIVVQTARDFSAHAVQLARRSARAIYLASKDELVAAVIKRIYEDGQKGYADRDVRVILGSYNGEARLTVQDRHFPTTLSVSDLQRAAKSIPEEESRDLLGRTGILSVVHAILEVAPDSTLTLTDRSEDGGRHSYYKVIVLKFDIGGREVELDIIQDRNAIEGASVKYRGTPAPYVQGLIRSPKEILSSDAGNSPDDFLVIDIGNRRSHYDMGLKGFKAFLERVRDRGPSAGGTPPVEAPRLQA